MTLTTQTSTSIPGIKVHWTASSIFLVTYHLVLLITLPFYFYYGTLHTATITCTIILLWVTGLSVTAGYHRYFSHRIRTLIL